MAEPTSTGNGSVEPDALHYNYIKSNHYRVVHADGAYGGITARGYIQFSIYNERKAIPQVTKVQLDEGGKSMGETTLEGREGVVRELEVCIMMDEPTTAELIVWLTDKLAKLQAAKKEFQLGVKE